MSVLIKILLILAGIVVLLLLTAIFVKKEYTVSREVTINRSADAVFSYIRFLKNQDAYSVWNRIDPAMKKTYSGTDGTVGFYYGWDSQDKRAGKGEQRIAAISPGHEITFDIHFIKPFDGRAVASMQTIALGDQSTKVTWGFNGKMAYPMNVMLLFMNMDNMVGKDLEGGLQNLKAILEK